jgi:hypothetical protein
MSSAVQTVSMPVTQHSVHKLSRYSAGKQYSVMELLIIVQSRNLLMKALNVLRGMKTWIPLSFLGLGDISIF